MSKYHNIKTTIDGYTFASRMEAQRYAELVLLKRAGKLMAVGVQPSFVVAPGIRYVGDFLCIGTDGKVWVEDVKGVETAVFKMKRKLFETAYPGIELRIVKRR